MMPRAIACDDRPYTWSLGALMSIINHPDQFGLDYDGRLESGLRMQEQSGVGCCATGRLAR